MKKRLFLITLITALVFTMCGLTALADEETLAVSAFYATQDCIELETNLAVTSVPTAEITDRSSNEVKTANVTLENDNKRIRIAVADEKFDLSKSYSVKVTGITDGTTTLSFEKVLSFDVLLNDDFESYNTNEDLFENWFRFTGNGQDIDASSASEFYDASFRDYAALDSKDNNKRLVLKKKAEKNGQWLFLVNRSTYLDTSKLDSYVLSYDMENARAAGFTVAIHNQYKDSGGSGTTTFQWDSNTHDFQNRIMGYGGEQIWWGDKLNDITNGKHSITQIANKTVGDKDELRIYSDGEFKWQVPEDKAFKYGSEKADFGFANGQPNNTDSANYVYIDNVKAYKPVWRDASDVLEISNTYATEGCVEIEVNKTLTQTPNVTVKDNANNVSKTANVTLENDNKRIRIAVADEKFDLDNSYTINVTNITDGTDKLSFNKVLSFNVLFKDDFESYADNTALFEKWSKFTSAGNDLAVSDEYAGLDETDGNKRLVLKKEALVGQYGNDAVLINNDVELNAAAYDSYVLSYDVENARNGQLIVMANNGSKYIGDCGSVIFGQDNNSKEAQTRVFVTGDQLWNNGSGTVLSELTNEKKTVTEISNRTGGDKDELRIYYNGEFKWQIPEDKSFKYGGNSGTFGFGNGYRNNTDSANYVYIDNVKAYKPVWSEPAAEDIMVLDSMISAKLINIEYTSKVTEISAKNLITLTANGEAVNTEISLSKDGKTVSVKPVSPLSEGKLYVLTSNGVSDISGNASPLYTKKFVVEDILNENFDNYTQKTDLDKNYTVMPMQSYPPVTVEQQKPSENAGVELANGKLKLTSDLGVKNAFTKFEKYPTRNEWDRDCIFEADIERVSEKDGLSIYFHTTYGSADTGIYGDSSFIKFYTEGNSTIIRNHLAGYNNTMEYMSAEGMTKRSMMFRVDGNTFSVYNNDSLLLQNKQSPLNVDGGEFAFQIENSEYLIDNIRAYKIREISDGELKLELFDARQSDDTANAKITIANNTGADIANALLFIGFYDDANKLIGTQLVPITSLENGKADVYSRAINASVNCRRTRAFLWNGSMRPLAECSILQ